MAIDRFEELVAWQKARALARDVYELTREGAFARDYDLQRQLRRSSVSVMANLAEGFDRNRPLEFLRFIDIARGSNAESVSHLYLALDIGYVSEQQFANLQRKFEELGRILRGLRQSVERSATRRNPGAAPSDRPAPLGTRDSGQGTWADQARPGETSR